MINQFLLNFLKRKIAFKLRKKLKNIKATRHTPKTANTLLVSHRHELSETMMYPIFWFADELTQAYQVNAVEIINNDLSQEIETQAAATTHLQVKRIFFQAELEIDCKRLEQTLTYLRHTYPNAKIAFMDWYAPLHIRPSKVVDPFIDFYIKKQTFTHFEDYSLVTQGDTNLSDYYSKKHQLNLPEEQFSPPANFESKIILWPNFSFSALMIDLFHQPLKQHQANQETIDLHSRIAIKGVPWYQAMRQEARDALTELQSKQPNWNILADGRVKRHALFKEMTHSRLCFSPFGYGEVCWRDFESYATGSLLLKPNMDHLKVYGDDFFIPDETYISLNWDLSDFIEKAEYYHQNTEARERIINNAFDVQQQALKSDKFIQHVSPLFNE